MSERTMLREHGTVLMQLKASSIVQAAEADLKLRERKREKEADPDARYSFARKHVHRARSVGHLIALAYFEPDAAATTTKDSTQVVYGDRAVLGEALMELLYEMVQLDEAGA